MTDPELCGDPDLAAVQAALFASSDLWLNAPDCFCQGRTLGLLGISLDNLQEKLAPHALTRRLLLEVRCTEVAAVVQEMQRADYAVSEPLTIMIRSVRGPPKPRAALVNCRQLSPGRQWQQLDAATDSITVRGVQELQRRCGITPMPGWFLRGRFGSSASIALPGVSNVVAAGALQSIWRANSRDSLILLAGLCVEPQLQGSGLGRALNDALMALGVEMFCGRQLAAIVEPDNLRSRRLYESSGFVVSPTDVFLFCSQGKL